MDFSEMKQNKGKKNMPYTLSLKFIEVNLNIACCCLILDGNLLLEQYFAEIFYKKI
jgi:hypothetical protein